MEIAAKALDFMQAAKLRDEIKMLQTQDKEMGKAP
jgi:protein-arginine kinase activator protein McsA